MAPVLEDPVAMGFILVAIASACSPIGALCVFFVRRCRPWLMCATLGAAGGVMIFVSPTEALSKAVQELATAGLSGAAAQAAAYGAFFVAFPLCLGLDGAVSGCLRPRGDLSEGGRCCRGGGGGRGAAATADVEGGQAAGDAIPAAGAPSPSASGRFASLRSTMPSLSDALGCLSITKRAEGEAASARALLDVAPDEFAHVHRANVMTVLAVAAHNLPEGIATFAGYYSSPKIGVAIAVAIALHNIPEGCVIGIGVLAATGSRARAVAWAALAGLAEPAGALIAWGLIAGGGAHPAVVGALLALAAGIMVFIALLELLPGALKFGSYTLTSAATFVGMAVMATSLVVLTLLSPEEGVVTIRGGMPYGGR